MGDLAVNNLLIVADEAGGQGTLVGMGVNNTSQEAEFTFTFEGGEPVSLTVPPYTSAQLSDPQAAGGQMSTIENTPVAPGNLVDVQIDAAGTGAHLARVPVLAPFPPYGDFHEAGPREFAPTPAAHPDGGH